MRAYRLYLYDIHQVMEAVKDIAGLSIEKLLADEKKLRPLIEKLEIIRERSTYLPKGLRSKYFSVDWNRVIGVRDPATATYSGFDPEELKRFLEMLPMLSTQIGELYEQPDQNWN